MEENLKQKIHDVLFGILSAIGLLFFSSYFADLVLPYSLASQFYSYEVFTLLFLFLTAKFFTSGLFRKVYVITSLLIVITVLLWRSSIF